MDLMRLPPSTGRIQSLLGRQWTTGTGARQSLGRTEGGSEAASQSHVFGPHSKRILLPSSLSIDVVQSMGWLLLFIRSFIGIEWLSFNQLCDLVSWSMCYNEQRLCRCQVNAIISNLAEFRVLCQSQFFLFINFFISPARDTRRYFVLLERHGKIIRMSRLSAVHFNGPESVVIVLPINNRLYGSQVFYDPKEGHFRLSYPLKWTGLSGRTIRALKYMNRRGSLKSRLISTKNIRKVLFNLGMEWLFYLSNIDKCFLEIKFLANKHINLC